MRLQRLAYVDDDADIREIVRFALCDIGGIELRCWNDGETFLRDIGGDWMPELVLLDVNLPGMSGWEILAALRGSPASAELPAVILSACDGSDGSSPDVAGRFSKPFDPLRLAGEIEEVWVRHCAREMRT